MSLQTPTSVPPKRNLLVPHKRSLLPVNSLHKQTTLNPSATPAEIQFRRPVFSSVGEGAEKKRQEDDAQEQDQTGISQRTGGEEVIRIEFDSSQASQPFLEPDVLERIRERQRQREKEALQNTASRGTADAPGAGLDTEREIRRRAVQTEYGSMAVRGRMAVGGRGRRGY